MLSSSKTYSNLFLEDSCVSSKEEKLSTYYLDPWEKMFILFFYCYGFIFKLLLQHRVMIYFKYQLKTHISSVTQSCPTLCDLMNHNTPGLSVHHQLPEFTQTHVHRVGDAIQSSHPLTSPSPSAPKPSQLFQ